MHPRLALALVLLAACASSPTAPPASLPSTVPAPTATATAPVAPAPAATEPASGPAPTPRRATRFARVLDGSTGLLGLALLPDGRIFVADQAAGQARVRRLAADGSGDAATPLPSPRRFTLRWVAPGDGDELVLGGTMPGDAEPAGEAPNDDPAVARVGKNGKTRWAAHAGDVGFESFGDAAVDASGDVAMVSGEGVVASYSAAGKRRWLARVEGVVPERVALGCDGSAAVLGRASDDLVLERRDGGGEVLWEQRFGSPHVDVPGGLAVDCDGRTFVAGGGAEQAVGTRADDEVYVWAFDAGGAVLWQRRLGTPRRDQPHDLALGCHGEVIVVGETAGVLGGTGGDGSDPFAAAWSREGELLWIWQEQTPDSDSAEAVAAGCPDAVLVGARVLSPPAIRLYGIVGP